MEVALPLQLRVHSQGIPVGFIILSAGCCNCFSLLDGLCDRCALHIGICVGLYVYAICSNFYLYYTNTIQISVSVCIRSTT